MITKELFIPTKIRVGFQTRQGTFTGKLAYVIYYDEKGKLRKEKSWEGWRDKNIEPVEFENTPMNGFIFNKGMQRSSEWFGSGRTVFRVYAPHDFEFEINSDNLINLLMHSDVSKREILEQCVFAWYGTELVLLPINSAEYQSSITYTAKQSLKISTKELVKGRQYHQKKSKEIVTYLGFFEWYDFEYENGKRRAYYPKDPEKYVHCSKGKKHIFKVGNSFQPMSASVLSHEVSDEVVANYAELVDDFFKTVNSQPIDRVEIRFGVTRGIDIPRYSYLEWPNMYKIVDDKLIQIYLSNGYGYRDDRNFEQHIFAREDKTQLFLHESKGGSLVRLKHPSTRMEYTRFGYGSNQTTRYDASLLSFHQMLKPIAESEGFDYKQLLPSQYVTIMTKLGYGKPVMILQNGTEVPYSSYY